MESRRAFKAFLVVSNICSPRFVGFHAPILTCAYFSQMALGKKTTTTNWIRIIVLKLIFWMEENPFPLRILIPVMETPDPPNDTPGASKHVMLTPHDIPKILRASCFGFFWSTKKRGGSSTVHPGNGKPGQPQAFRNDIAMRIGLTQMDISSIKDNPMAELASQHKQAQIELHKMEKKDLCWVQKPVWLFWGWRKKLRYLGIIFIKLLLREELLGCIKPCK